MSAPNVRRGKKKRIKVFFINLILNKPSEILIKVLKINLKKFKEIKKDEKRNKIKKHLINKLRRAKEIIKEIK